MLHFLKNNMKKRILIFTGLLIFAAASSSLFSQEEIWDAKGQKAMQLNKFDEAIEYFGKAIKLDPRNKHTFYNRGLAFLYSSKFEESVGDFSKVIELDSNYADAYNNRGLSYNYLDKFDSSIADFDRAVRIDSNFTEAYINRGSANLGMGRTELAMKDFSKAISLNSQNPAVYVERGRLNYKTRRFEEAVDDFTKSIKLGMKSPKIYYNRGNAYFGLKKFDLAIKDYTRVLTEDSLNTEALNNRAISFENLYQQEQGNDSTNVKPKIKKGKKAKSNLLELAEADRKKLFRITGTEDRFKPIDSLKFVKYTNKSGDISLNIPDTWHLMENHEHSVDEMIITFDKISAFEEPYSVGVRLSINRDMDSLYKVKEPVALLDFWKGSMAKNAEEYYRYDLLSQKTFNRGTYVGSMNKTRLQVKQDYYPLKIIEVVLAKSDVLFYAYFQAPEAQFGYYEKIFEKAIESLYVK